MLTSRQQMEIKVDEKWNENQKQKKKRNVSEIQVTKSTNLYVIVRWLHNSTTTKKQLSYQKENLCLPLLFAVATASAVHEQKKKKTHNTKMYKCRRVRYKFRLNSTGNIACGICGRS